jgi:hypothetical protein
MSKLPKKKPNLVLNLGESFENKNNDNNNKNKYMIHGDSNYSILNGSQSIEL